jgi:MFS superfamily sulfate permease-like transporter
VLGRIAGTTSWAPLEAAPTTQTPGVLVLLFATPLWYANAVHFREEVTAALARAPGEVRVLVLDTIGMTDIDFTGARALGRVLTECDRRHIDFAVARAGEHVCNELSRSGLAARIGADHFYLSVDEAVRALDPGPSPA